MGNESQGDDKSAQSNPGVSGNQPDKAAADKIAADKLAADKAAEEAQNRADSKAVNAENPVMGFIMMAIAFLLGGFGGGKEGGGFMDMLKSWGQKLGLVPSEDATKTDASQIAKTSTIQQTGEDGKTQVNVHQSQIIEGTLIALSNTTEAAKLKNPDIAFLSDKNSFVPSTEAGSVTEKSITNVRIMVDGQAHYFSKIGGVDGTNGTKTGLKASAWIETNAKGERLAGSDGKSDIHIAFGGYTGRPTDDSDQTKSLKAVVNGELNPQAIEAARFTQGVIDEVASRLGGRDKIGGVISAGHSSAASNAIAGQVVTRLDGVPFKLQLLIEPAAAALEKQKIQDALLDKGSDFYRQMQRITGATDDQMAAEARKDAGTLDKDIANNTISIRSIYTEKARENGAEVTRVYETSAAALKFGDPAAVEQQIMGMLGGQKYGLVLDPAQNPGNAMLGRQLYQETSGIQDNATDSHHLLSNIITAEMKSKDSDYYTAQQMMQKAGVTTATQEAFNSIGVQPGQNSKTR